MPPVARTAPSLHLTSAFKPGACRHVSDFICHFRKYGWNDRNLGQLMQDLTTMMRNFERACQGEIKLRATLGEGLPNGQEGLALLSGNEITIDLRTGPKKMLGFGTHNLSHFLIETLFELDYPKKTALMLESIKGTGNFDLAVDAIVDYYINERQASLDLDILRRQSAELLEITGRETVERKFAYQLLRPRSFTGRELEAIIDVLIDGIHETVSQQELSINDFESLVAVARLATFATLAKKAGNITAYLKCLDLLLGKTAEAMAWIEFAQIEIAEEENISRHVYPAASEHKVAQAIRGYRLIFNTIQHLAEYYYDNVQLA
jgi:hypothetical protein